MTKLQDIAKYFHCSSPQLTTGHFVGIDDFGYKVLPVVDEVASCVVGPHSPGNLLGPLGRPAASHRLHPRRRRRPPEEPRASADGRGLGHQPTPWISESTERAAGQSFQVLK